MKKMLEAVDVQILPFYIFYSIPLCLPFCSNNKKMDFTL